MAFEFFFLGLRKIEGVDLCQFREIYGEERFFKYNQAFILLSERGFINEKAIKTENCALYTEQGVLFSDSILEELAALRAEQIAIHRGA